MEILIRVKKFFDYSQNNSGGGFDMDDAKGICETVIIEAENAEDADRRAEEIGLYFNGCASGVDCPCCGNRWSAQNTSWRNEEGDPVPSIYGTPVWGTSASMYRSRAFIHYLDGRVEEVRFAEGKSWQGFDWEDEAPEKWKDLFDKLQGEREGASSRSLTIMKLRKMMRLAKDQADKPEGKTALRMAQHLAKQNNIDLESWA